MKYTFDIKRLWILVALASLMFAILFWRLVQLQIVQGEQLLKVSEGNRIRAVEIHPVRGKIYDRHGKLLVDNRPSFSVFVVPWEMRRNPKTASFLVRSLQLDSLTIKEKISRQRSQPFKPTRIARDVPFASIATLEEHMSELPGVLVRIETKRHYPVTNAPHLLGYIGELSKENPKIFPGVPVGGIVGKSGLELQYDNQLRGEKGVKFIQVDALGRELGEVYKETAVPPVPGADLYLTLDLHLMNYADSLLGDRPGSVVAIEPWSGEIFVLLSKPRYDPNLFSGVMSPETWKQLQEDPDKPLLHRAIQSGYPPASTLKMAILAAALESGAINESHVVNCTGVFQLGRRPYRCWRQEGHGSVGLLKSIEESCDVFYYQVGLAAGLDVLESMLKAFHFGTPTGIDLDSEISGLVPGKDYYDRRYGPRGWTKGLIPNISIGQGEVLVSPVQMARHAAILATRGRCSKPHLYGGLSPVGWQPFTEREYPYETLELHPETWDIIQEGMRLVLHGEKGTAQWLNPQTPMAGKTGTAQNPHGEDHAWFVAFAPYNNPKIAVSVLVEHGEHGSTAAAPIAVKLIQEFLRRTPTEELIAEK